MELQQSSFWAHSSKSGALDLTGSPRISGWLPLSLHCPTIDCDRPPVLKFSPQMRSPLAVS
ncbi:hypothetical protein N0Y54_29385 [Nostoc punctiforme UO1]|uniref:hypothetical protein n=1 Tax=Nostoc punctiforme TaxID=272131 RepID=UPI0002F49B86